MPLLPGKLRRLLPYVLIFGLLGAVYLLPPDTSLSEVRKAGVLRACMPPSYPPLVTGDRDAPGLDRLAVSSYLRAQNAEVIVTPNVAEFVTGLRDGRFDVGITEWLLAGQLAARNGWSVAWMPAELPRYPVAFGLWKGDLTLKRAIAEGLEKLRRDGEVARIIARYVGDGQAKGDAMLSV